MKVSWKNRVQYIDLIFFILFIVILYNTINCLVMEQVKIFMHLNINNCKNYWKKVLITGETGLFKVPATWPKLEDIRFTSLVQKNSIYLFSLPDNKLSGKKAS